MKNIFAIIGVSVIVVGVFLYICYDYRRRKGIDTPKPVDQKGYDTAKAELNGIAKQRRDGTLDNPGPNPPKPEQFKPLFDAAGSAYMAVIEQSAKEYVAAHPDLFKSLESQLNSYRAWAAYPYTAVVMVSVYPDVKWYIP